MTIMAPRSEEELGPMLAHAIALGKPVAIRYPRGNTQGNHAEPPAPIVQGKAEVLRAGAGVALLAFGNTCDAALDAYDMLAGEGGALPTVVNMRFAAPLDEALLEELTRTHKRFITLEEHALAGGFGSAVLEFLSDRGLRVAVERVGVPHVLIQHAKQTEQRESFGLSGEQVAARVRVAEVVPHGVERGTIADTQPTSAIGRL
jgi:1-deoxy-D-xylulose-5-phosphate synthase